MSLAADPAARPAPAELAAELEQLVAGPSARLVLSRFRIRPRRRDSLGLGGS